MTAGTTAARLSRAALRAAGAALPEPPVRIVHLGIGAFARAHQAWYTAHASDGRDWGIVAFTGRSADMAERLGARHEVIEDAIHSPAVENPGRTFDVLCDFWSGLPARS